MCFRVFSCYDFGRDVRKIGSSHVRQREARYLFQGSATPDLAKYFSNYLV